MQGDQNAKEKGLSIFPAPLKNFLQYPSIWILTANLLCILTYMNGLNGELVHDDIFAIRDNADLRPTTPLSNLLLNDFWGDSMTSPTSHKSYRPLTVLTFRLNYYLHSLDPWGYHAVNVSLHILATVLFGWLCKRVVFGVRGRDAAFVAMCVFAVHPVHTEAVTGIVGRADVLACVLFLVSFLLYWSSTSDQHLGLRTAKFTGCLATGAAAMLSKEHGATVFGVCVAYDVLVVNKHILIKCLTRRTLMTSELRPLTLRCSLLVLTTVALLVFRVWLLHGHLPHFGPQDNPASFDESKLTRAMTYSYLYYFNAKLLFYPAVLCYDYQIGSIPLLQSLTDQRVLSTAFFYFVISCLSWRGLYGNSSKCTHNVTLIGLILIVVPFLPASNLFIRVGFVVAERILYISSMGYCILISHGANLLASRFKSYRPMISLLLLTLVSVFALRTVARNPVWASRESLFRSGLHTIPHNAKIHFNFANFLKDSGRTNEAIAHYQTALRLFPEHAVSHNNLGTLLSNASEAELHFREAVKHNPQHFKAFFNLASNLALRGKTEEAETFYRKSLAINPTYTDPLMGLGSLLADEGKLEEGWHYMEQAASVAPDNADVLNNLAAYLLRLGKTEDAVTTYKRALEINPTHATVMTGLARVYRSQGLNEKAEKWFKRSLDIKEDAVTLHYLAALYHNTGSLERAVKMFERALKLNPNRYDTACGCGQTLLQLHRYDDILTLVNKALKDDSSISCLHSLAANTHVQMGDLKKALQHSSAAVKSKDESSKFEALHVHGRILKDMGRFTEAEQAFRQAVLINPTHPSSRINLGALLHLTKDYSGARTQYEKALELDPGNQLVLDNLKKLERLVKKQSL